MRAIPAPSAHCHLGLARSYLGAGRIGPGKNHLGAAADLYRALDMRFWLKDLERVAVQAPGTKSEW